MTSPMPLQVPNNSIPLVDTETGRATLFFQQFLVALAAANGPSLQARVGVLEGDVVAIDDTLAALSAAVAALAADIAVLTTDVATLTSEVATLTIEVAANTAQLALLPASRLVGSEAAYTPGAILAQGLVTKTITVTGALLGQESAASFSLALGGLLLFAEVTAADTVTATFYNPTLATITPAAGTLKGFAWTP